MLCVTLARLQCPYFWFNTSLHFTVKVFLKILLTFKLVDFECSRFPFKLWVSWSSSQLFSCYSVVSDSLQPRLFATPWNAACQASLFIKNTRSLLKLMSIASVMPANNLTLGHPFSSYLQFFPASGSFPMSQLFSWGGQSIGVSASASVLPVNIQDWFPLGWTGWISLQSKGLARVFSNTTVKKHQFFCAQLSL